VIEAKQA